MRLPHAVTRLRASVSVDRKNVNQDDWAAASSLPFQGWVQPRGTSEAFEPEGTRVRSTHVLFCTLTDLKATDRVLHDGLTFLVVGNPARHETPAGYHHTEADLLLVEG